MVYRGHVQNGVVVFDEKGSPLPDGTPVEVAPIARPSNSGSTPTADTGPSWAEVLKDVIGRAEGLPTDMARNHDHYIHGAPKR
jgi:hypothetical protein